MAIEIPPLHAVQNAVWLLFPGRPFFFLKSAAWRYIFKSAFLLLFCAVVWRLECSVLCRWSTRSSPAMSRGSRPLWCAGDLVIGFARRGIPPDPRPISQNSGFLKKNQGHTPKGRAKTSFGSCSRIQDPFLSLPRLGTSLQSENAFFHTHPGVCFPCPIG